MPAPLSSREQFEVYKFHWLTAVLVPLAALLLQAYLPLRVPFFDLFDLPLLVTIYFGVARRNQLTGMVTGCLLGLAQDALTHRPLGLYGMAKTVVGYAASSLGLRIDVDNPGSRLLLGFSFYIVHQFVYFAIARGLAIQSLTWRWGHEVFAAFANALMALVLFTLLDRLRQRA